MNHKCLTCAILAPLLGALTLSGQTRTAQIEAEREAKAARLKPENVSILEDALLQIKQRKILERISAGYNGLRFKMGGMATGSGFALGPQFYREDFASGRLRVDASVVFSTKQWQRHEAAFTLPKLGNGEVSLHLQALRRDYRSLEYYGSGPDSSRDQRTNYRLKDTSVELGGGVTLLRNFRTGGYVGGLWTALGTGNNDDLADTFQRFTEADSPGLSRQSNYLRYGLFAQLDYRDDPAGPKSGGNYVSQYTWYDDRSLDVFGFRRWDIDVQQYLPFFNKTRRLALRARMTLTDTSAGQQAPFYLQPTIGGADDLRGFRAYRFADRNAVVYNAEYRWEVFSGLDGALFFDAGKVMPHRGWLAFSDLETSAGFGFRFNARNRTFLRLDVGFSHEGAAVWLKFNDPFQPRLFGTASNQPQY